MNPTEYRFVDKSEWPKGPWMTEPDKIVWTDPATGYPCMIVRHERLGNLCGYVAVTESHPFFKKPYDDLDVSVHGGLTYAAFCQKGFEERGVCHIPEPGQSDHVCGSDLIAAIAGICRPASSLI